MQGQQNIETTHEVYFFIAHIYSPENLVSLVLLIQ